MYKGLGPPPCQGIFTPPLTWPFGEQHLARAVLAPGILNSY